MPLCVDIIYKRKYFEFCVVSLVFVVDGNCGVWFVKSDFSKFVYIVFS